MSMNFPAQDFSQADPVRSNSDLFASVDYWFPRLPWDDVVARHDLDGIPARWAAMLGENTVHLDHSDFAQIEGPDAANDLWPIDVIAFALDAEDDAEAWAWFDAQFSEPEPEVQVLHNKDRADRLFDLLTPMTEVQPVLLNRALVKGWLDRGALSVVYGPSNVGKTFFTFDIAAHIAAGLPWNGMKVEPNPNGEAVIYVAAEGGTGIENRLRALAPDRPELATEAFKLLPATVDFFGQADYVAIIEMVRRNRLKVRLLVLDTLARTMGEGDENSTKDMGKYVANADALRQALGCHVKIVHHSGKDATKGARGSVSLRAAADTEIELSADFGVTTASQRKQRDMPQGDPFAFTLRQVLLGYDEDNEPVTSAVIEPAEVRRNTAMITGPAGIALAALDALLDRGASELMHGNLLPTDRQGVRLDAWRKECDLRRLSEGETGDAKRMAFTRARDKLKAVGVVGWAGDYAWRAVDD